MKKDTKTTAKEVITKAETAAKATAAKAETAVKATAAKAETAAKKAATKKPAAKKPATRKPAAKKPVVNAMLQFAGKEISVAEMAEQAKAAWNGGEVKEMNLYIKPEDSRVYVVINGEEAGSFEL